MTPIILSTVAKLTDNALVAKCQNPMPLLTPRYTGNISSTWHRADGFLRDFLFAKGSKVSQPLSFSPISHSCQLCFQSTHDHSLSHPVVFLLPESHHIPPDSWVPSSFFSLMLLWPCCDLIFLFVCLRHCLTT